MRNYLYGVITGKKKDIPAKGIKLFLIVLSWLYLAGLWLVKLFYILDIFRRSRFNCRIISVGNITWGGAGKTPLVEFLAQKLKGKGRRIAVLTRGYKSHDEPVLLQRRLADIPVLIGRDRVKNVQEAISKYAVDTIILDDGFQHWRLKRDLDIVAINALNPFGDGYLLPAGILREPLGALRRAHIFVLTKTGISPSTEELERTLYKLKPRALLVHSVYELDKIMDSRERQVNLVELKAKPCAALSGIADPDSFEKMLMNMGINIVLKLRFPDHHNYTAEDIDRIKKDCAKHNISAVITTEKDAVKIKHKMDYFYCKIKVKISEDEAFFDRIFSVL